MWLSRATLPDYPDPQQIDTRIFLLGGLDHGAGSLSSACWEGWFPCHTHYPTAGELYVYLWRKHTHDLMVPSQGPPTPRGHKYSAYKQGLMTTQAKTLLPQICRDPQIPGDMSRCAVWVDMRQFQKSNCTILDTKLFKMQWKNAYFHHHSHLKLSGQCKDAFIFPETVIVGACLWSQRRFGFACKNSLVPPICLVTTQVDPPIPVACRNDIPWDCSRRCLSSHIHGYTPELWLNASLSPINITCWWFSGFS